MAVIQKPKKKQNSRFVPSKIRGASHGSLLEHKCVVGTRARPWNVRVGKCSGHRLLMAQGLRSERRRLVNEENRPMTRA